jgi:hypothetical protein
MKHKGSKDLKRLVEQGILKDGEEIYLEYKDVEFSGRIREGGLIIETEGNLFPTISGSTIYLKEIYYKESNKTDLRKSKTANGYNEWKNWNGITLDELRKKLTNN